MNQQPKISKAGMALIEKAAIKDLMNDVSDEADPFTLLHTSCSSIGKLVDNGYFEVVHPQVSGHRSIGYTLTQKGRAAFNHANDA